MHHIAFEVRLNQYRDEFPVVWRFYYGMREREREAYVRQRTYPVQSHTTPPMLQVEQGGKAMTTQQHSSVHILSSTMGIASDQINNVPPTKH